MNTAIENAARGEGLVFLGVTALSYPEDYARFVEWRGEGRHAGMKYLEVHDELRSHPERLHPGARSAIILALPYYDSEKIGVARYARFPDYHRVLRQRAERVARALFEPGEYRVTVDSAPVLERALAARTSRGFIGKNTLYIHPDHGSFLLLGEVLVTRELAADSPAEISLERKTHQGGCGPCKQCQTNCPTGALDRDYSINASRCLSYWTIENRGTIPEEFWPWLGEMYFGCDLCQLACPYNKRPAKPPSDWQRRSYPPLSEVAVLSQADYEKHFGGTPLTRAKRNGLRRNALIALAVKNDPALMGALAQVDSDGDEMLRATRAQIERWKPLEGHA